MDHDELLTVAQIAAQLRVNEQTVRNWISAGRLPHLRIGPRRVRVYRSDFEAFLRAAAGEDRPQAREPGPLTGQAFWDGVIPEPVWSDETR